ncbi:uncharacterized protein LOC126797122 [Argentina anserina]|uniref:uncharacterized protein LOC126797122 n=1 Tax=Argentina anserina TaxID=57926 RepID=UPI00217651B3|nr:uncharacterized protein LOC126797122 [Potentilla anserina]
MELEIAFHKFGIIKRVWVVRRPQGYAFIDFDHIRDAKNAICELDDKNDQRVEFSHDSRHVVGKFCTNGNTYASTKPRAGGKIVSYVTNANGEAFPVLGRGIFSPGRYSVGGGLRSRLFHLDQTYAGAKSGA